MPGNTPLRGDIYHVKFDPPAGPHYAVVVTADAINRSADTVLMAAITSQRVATIYPHEFKLSDNLLKKPSKVKCHNLVMVPKEQLRESNYAGAVAKRDIEGLNAALMKALDLWY